MGDVYGSGRLAPRAPDVNRAPEGAEEAQREQEGRQRQRQRQRQRRHQGQGESLPSRWASSVVSGLVAGYLDSGSFHLWRSPSLLRLPGRNGGSSSPSRVSSADGVPASSSTDRTLQKVAVLHQKIPFTIRCWTWGNLIVIVAAAISGPFGA